jgi:hypothetical protein
MTIIIVYNTGIASVFQQPVLNDLLPKNQFAFLLRTWGLYFDKKLPGFLKAPEVPTNTLL